MSERRPDERGFTRLPMLAESKVALETCTYCPKLCRTVCPVSNAEPREALTPWGKMSSAYHLARGDLATVEGTPTTDLETERGFAKVAYACTGCGACKNACDHRNPVYDTLFRARSAATRAGLAPESAKRVLAAFDQKAGEAELAARRIDPGAERRPVALVVGCGYMRHAEPEAREALAVARKLTGRDVRLVGGCCGLPLLHAGDGERFDSHLTAFVKELSRFDEVLVLDAGCARVLRDEAPRRGAGDPRAELVVERAAKELAGLAPLGEDERGERVTYHDPCALSRGLGVTEAPRAVLTRLLGRAPEELVRNREDSVCSGAGGLLPVTHPEIAEEVARARVSEHAAASGGTWVTACSSSLRAFRRSAPQAKVEDVVTWIARGLGVSEAKDRG